VGGHQVERIQKNAASPRWGWSGVREIVPPVWSEAELRRVANLLPSRQSSIDNIVAELHAIGGRYHRNLHQDEFGPTRAERMQALRDLLVRLGVLSSRLEALPPQLRLLLSEGFLECRSAVGQLDVDPVASYSADKTAIEVVSETASDVRHTLASVGRTDEAKLIGEVCAAAGTILPLLWNLDTTTDGDVVIDAGSAGPLPTNDSADPFLAVCAPVRRLRSQSELALTHLRRRKGPEARLSLGLLVSQLCDLWRRETGQPVTANPFGWAPTRAAHNRHPDASCARRLKLCSRPPLRLTNTRRSEPTCAPQS
jgi:hypothetical protein